MSWVLFPWDLCQWAGQTIFFIDSVRQFLWRWFISTLPMNMVTQGPRMPAYTRKTFCLSRPCLWVFFCRALYLGFKEDSFTWFSLAVDCVMVELKLSWFNTVFLKALLPFKYKRFQVLGDPRESWSDVFTRTLLTGMSRSSSVRSAL